MGRSRWHSTNRSKTWTLVISGLLQGETWIHKAKYTILGRWWNRREPHKTCTLCTNLITKKHNFCSPFALLFIPPLCVYFANHQIAFTSGLWWCFTITQQTKGNGQMLLFPLLTWLALSGGYTRINKASCKAASRNVIWHSVAEILAKILLVR